MRYFFHIAYHGTNYSGWQKHAGVPTVQQALETCLAKLLKTPTPIFGCGRTDAHVHASQFFFHADIHCEWNNELFFRLNKILPDDIAVFNVLPVNNNAHARFDAIRRTYNYYIHHYKDPFLSAHSAYYADKNLNLDGMRRAIALLTQYDDYRAFCKSPDRNSHTLCIISLAELFVSENGDRMRFQVSANRFLSKMVRIIIGRLLEISQGKMSVDEFEHYLAEKETPKVIIPAYPQGLYLTEVAYPYLEVPVKTDFYDLMNF